MEFRTRAVIRRIRMAQYTLCFQHRVSKRHPGNSSLAHYNAFSASRTLHFADPNFRYVRNLTYATGSSGNFCSAYSNTTSTYKSPWPTISVNDLSSCLIPYSMHSLLRATRMIQLDCVCSSNGITESNSTFGLKITQLSIDESWVTKSKEGTPSIRRGFDTQMMPLDKLF